MQSSHETMDAHGRQEGSGPLPEELMGKIMAMVPFPHILLVRLLSKSWLARLQPISSEDGEDEKLLVKGFQNQLREQSNNWDSFYPVCANEGNLVGYNRRSKIWQRLAPLRYLPKKLIRAWQVCIRPGYYRSRPKNLLVHGVLLYGTPDDSRHARRLYVANILTQEWKKLPPYPASDFSKNIVSCINLVSCDSSEAYKLILSFHGIRSPPFAQIYDSRSGTWSRKSFVHSVGYNCAPTTFAYLEGVLYGISVNNWRSIVAFNVEEGTMGERIMPSTFKDYIISLTGTNFIVPAEKEYDVVKLMVCNGRLTLILNGFDYRSLTVFEIDVKSLQWREVAHCDLEDLEVDICDSRVGEDDYIFMEVDEPGRDVFSGAMVVYNKDEDKWRFFQFTEKDYNLIDCSFEPGLNPFMGV